jgi:hypothetical protein
VAHSVISQAIFSLFANGLKITHWYSIANESSCGRQLITSHFFFFFANPQILSFSMDIWWSTLHPQTPYLNRDVIARDWNEVSYYLGMWLMQTRPWDCLLSIIKS